MCARALSLGAHHLPDAHINHRCMLYVCAHPAQVRLLSVLSVVPAFSILTLSVLALYSKAVQSRPCDQGHTIKAAQSRPLLKLHTQDHTVKHQCRLLKIARSGDKTARSRLRAQPRGGRSPEAAQRSTQRCSSHTISGPLQRPHTQASMPLKLARSKSLGSFNKAARSRALAQPRPLAHSKPTT